MKLSEKRQMALYEAVSEPIMRTRIAITQRSDLDRKDIDSRLFALEIEIWKSIKQALDIKDGPQ